MKSNFLKSISLIGLVALSPMAGAVVIDSIDMTVRTSHYSVQTHDTAASLTHEFYNNGHEVCSVSLDVVSNVGSKQTCGGPGSDIATLISVNFTQDANTLWQFGGDWGRGGVIYRVGEIVTTNDIWWKKDWNNSDVFTFYTGGSGTLNLLGFENCCGGGMSLRYSTDHGHTWTIAEVNVPAPGILALLGLGMMGLGVARRRA